MRPELSLLLELLARSVCERWKAVNTFQGRRQPHHRNSTIRYLKPETWPAVRREARQVHLGANGCKTLQIVAGAGYLLIYQMCA